jgi:hypothetical protein
MNSPGGAGRNNNSATGPNTIPAFLAQRAVPRQTFEDWVPARNPENPETKFWVKHVETCSGFLDVFRCMFFHKDSVHFSTIGHLMRIIDGVSHSEAATPRDCEVYQLFIQPLAVKSPFLWQPRNSGHFQRDLDDFSMF